MSSGVKHDLTLTRFANSRQHLFPERDSPRTSQGDRSGDAGDDTMGEIVKAANRPRESADMVLNMTKRTNDQQRNHIRNARHFDELNARSRKDLHAPVVPAPRRQRIRRTNSTTHPTFRISRVDGRNVKANSDRTMHQGSLLESDS